MWPGSQLERHALSLSDRHLTRSVCFRCDRGLCWSVTPSPCLTGTWPALSVSDVAGVPAGASRPVTLWPTPCPLRILRQLLPRHLLTPAVTRLPTEHPQQHYPAEYRTSISCSATWSLLTTITTIITTTTITEETVAVEAADGRRRRSHRSGVGGWRDYS